MGRRGKGRGGRSAKTDDEPSPLVPFSLSTALNFSGPVTDRDDELVWCSDCPSFQCTFRDFQTHNLQYHYNIARTRDDTTIIDHKFYTKKIKEIGKLLKTTTFICPRQGCDSRYKSALGLGYHLETCGKTKEEINALMVECDVCHKKFTLPNLNWHKRAHHGPERVEEDPNLTFASLSRKRKSAEKARKVIEGMSETSKEQRRGGPSGSDDDECDDPDFVEVKTEDWWPPSNIYSDGSPKATQTEKADDINSLTYKYLQSTTEETNVWDTPQRNLVDPFTTEVLRRNNPLENVKCEKTMRLYLPGLEKSFEFKTKTSSGDDDSPIFTNYHQLDWFESEIVGDEDPTYLVYAGGPVTSMAWHPNGNCLAVTTMKHYMETPDLVNIGRRRTSIQIYITSGDSAQEFSMDFDLALIVGLDYGNVNHLQWGNYWPSCDAEPASKEDSRFGYICCALEDSTCRIFSIVGKDFELGRNFVYKKGQKVRFYRKVPEIVLCIPESTKQSTGQCTRFDWHEGNRYLVTGYASGLVAVFDLEAKSKFLRVSATEGESPLTMFYPFWMFRGHKWPIVGVHIDPAAPRYFYTSSMDRYLKTWDVHLRQEIEAKKIGMVLDTCWIRGWIHIVASTELAVSNLSSQFNFAKFYQVGSSQGRPNCIEHYNLTSLTFYEGLTVQASENGKVTVTYFDAFWRECDFDRNKRKKNAVHLCSIDLDEETVIPLSGDWMKDRTKKNDTVPKVILSFVKERLQGQSLAQVQPELSPQQGENLIRYYHLLRINKVSWSPSGKYLATGYRNGLVTIMPATFDVLYNTDTT